MCAWHDANRTPPLYGPRAAPPGIMSCGCTFEQTLFEETLARNGIGSVFLSKHVNIKELLIKSYKSLET